MGESTTDEAPCGWTGGEIEHTGGGVRTRTWLNEERGLRVEYDIGEFTVGLDYVEYNNEIDAWEFAGRTSEFNTEPETDEQAREAAIRIMKRVESGDVNL